MSESYDVEQKRSKGDHKDEKDQKGIPLANQLSRDPAVFTPIASSLTDDQQIALLVELANYEADLEAKVKEASITMLRKPIPSDPPAALREHIYYLQRSEAFLADHVATVNKIGIIKAKLGLLEEALASFNQALVVRPDDKNVLLNCSIVQQKIDLAKKPLPCFAERPEPQRAGHTPKMTTSEEKKSSPPLSGTTAPSSLEDPDMLLARQFQQQEFDRPLSTARAPEQKDERKAGSASAPDSEASFFAHPTSSRTSGPKYVQGQSANFDHYAPS